jgi:IclR family pca regulon transcriptional regulator
VSRGNGDEVASVVKLFNLLQLFGPDLPRVTITTAADLTGVSKPSARRLLLTCVSQGFMQTDGRAFWLTPKVMRLGFGYLSALPFWESAQPHLREVADRVGETCSMASLDGDEIVYLLRIPVQRGMITLNVGSRLPAHATSLGKALLAHSPSVVIDDFLAGAPYERLTPSTLCTREELQAEFEKIRVMGYALNDSEREVGVRSASVPVLDRGGHAMAAVNVSANAMKVSARTLEEEYVPVLLEAAVKISGDLGYRPTA